MGTRNNASQALRWATIAMVALAVGCSDDEDAGECSVTAQNTWIQETMQEWYLENDQLPDLDPAAFESPQAFVNALTEDVDLAPNSPVDGVDRFSVVTALQTEINNVNNVFSGFGLLMQVETRPTETSTAPVQVIRVLDVYGLYPGEVTSPASEAGLVRGDIIETFDDMAVAERFNLDRLIGAKFIFGFDVGETHDLGVVKLDGQRQTLTITAAELMPSSVPLFTTFQQGDDQIGYVLFRDFTLEAVERLREAFVSFDQQGVTKLIIDVRYNLGGFVFVIDYLADLMLGRDLGGGTVVQRAESWNDDKDDRFDQSVVFSTPSCPGFLSGQQFDCQGPVTGLTGLTEVVFINSNNTASASEILQNSIRAHVEVGTVGGRTAGKPVGSVPFPGFEGEAQDFCGLVLRPITFRNVNADGEGDFFNGIVPDCASPDDPTVLLGEAAEASIAAALDYLGDRSCASRVSGGLRAEAPRRTLFLDAEHTYSYANSLARLRDLGLLYR